MLVSIRSSGLLYLLDSAWQHLRLRTGACFLDQGARSLHRPIRHVVHQRRHQHLNGLRHHHPPDARDSKAAARISTKVSADWHLRCRRLVSTYSPHITQTCVARPKRFASAATSSRRTTIVHMQ
jgi:hypothetical protein